MIGPLPDRWKQDVTPEEAKNALKNVIGDEVTLSCSLGTTADKRMFMFIRGVQQQYSGWTDESWTPSFKWKPRLLLGSIGKFWKDEITLPHGQLIKLFCGRVAMATPNVSKYFIVGNQYPRIMAMHSESVILKVSGNMKELSEDEISRANLPRIRTRTDYTMHITEE